MKIKLGILVSLVVFGFSCWAQDVTLPEEVPLPSTLPDDPMFEDLPVGLTCMQFLTEYNPKEACQTGDTKERDLLRRKYLRKSPAVINAWDFALGMRGSLGQGPNEPSNPKKSQSDKVDGLRGISQDSMTLLLASAQISSVMTRMCNSFYRDCGESCPELVNPPEQLPVGTNLKKCSELYKAAKVFQDIAKGNLDAAKAAASTVSATSAAPAGGK